MTVHVVSVGVNLLERFFVDPAGLGDQSDAGWAAAEAIDSRQPGALLSRLVDRDREAASRLLTQWFGPDVAVPAEVRQLVGAVRPDLWPPKASAELDTFDRAARSRFVSDDDIAVLLASDTMTGMTAAVWNAIALTEGGLDRVRYLASTEESPAGTRGRVVIVRTAGLDASSPQGFRDAMGGLGVLGRGLLRTVTRRAEPFRFYLSGGFKAAIPYLIGLAEGLRSLPPDTAQLRPPGTVEAFVLHESADAKEDPIRLPLRRMPPDLVQSALDGFDARGRRTTPPHDVFDGYLYEQVGRREWALTAFGEGIQALFPRTPEALPQ